METTLPAQKSNPNIQLWVKQLGNLDEVERIIARSLLIKEGVTAVPRLIKALSNGKQQTRLETAQILARTRDPSAASALVQALTDEDHDVRWAAMKALIALDRGGLEPLLQALVKDLDSVWLLEGAHHILHVLKNRAILESLCLKYSGLWKVLSLKAQSPGQLKRPGRNYLGQRSKAVRINNQIHPMDKLLY